jgi:hypothetical protein
VQNKKEPYKKEKKNQKCGCPILLGLETGPFCSILPSLRTYPILLGLKTGPFCPILSRLRTCPLLPGLKTGPFCPILPRLKTGSFWSILPSLRTYPILPGLKGRAGRGNKARERFCFAPGKKKEVRAHVTFRAKFSKGIHSYGNYPLFFL